MVVLSFRRRVAGHSAAWHAVQITGVNHTQIVRFLCTCERLTGSLRPPGKQRWGIESPRTWAVLRLTMSANLAGRSTGRSAGVIPCRSVSTEVAAQRSVCAGKPLHLPFAVRPRSPATPQTRNAQDSETRDVPPRVTTNPKRPTRHRGRLYSVPRTCHVPPVLARHGVE
jgi:hypothetical protein